MPLVGLSEGDHSVSEDRDEEEAAAIIVESREHIVDWASVPSQVKESPGREEWVRGKLEEINSPITESHKG